MQIHFSLKLLHCAIGILQQLNSTTWIHLLYMTYSGCQFFIFIAQFTYNLYYKTKCQQLPELFQHFSPLISTRHWALFIYLENALLYFCQSKSEATDIAAAWRETRHLTSQSTQSTYFLVIYHWPQQATAFKSFTPSCFYA